MEDKALIRHQAVQIKEIKKKREVSTRQGNSASQAKITDLPTLPVVSFSATLWQFSIPHQTEQIQETSARLSARLSCNLCCIN